MKTILNTIFWAILTLIVVAILGWFNCFSESHIITLEKSEMVGNTP